MFRITDEFVGRMTALIPPTDADLTPTESHYADMARRGLDQIVMHHGLVIGRYPDHDAVMFLNEIEKFDSFRTAMYVAMDEHTRRYHEMMGSPIPNFGAYVRGAELRKDWLAGAYDTYAEYLVAVEDERRYAAQDDARDLNPPTDEERAIEHRVYDKRAYAMSALADTYPTGYAIEKERLYDRAPAKQRNFIDMMEHAKYLLEVQKIEKECAALEEELRAELPQKEEPRFIRNCGDAEDIAAG